ncbi:MAG: DUF2497 domain-containing protein [Pseudomonadota bacterium]
MTNPQRQSSRASMEDILSSIRRIIDESVPEHPVVPTASVQPPYVNGPDTDDEPQAVVPSNPLSPRSAWHDAPNGSVPAVERAQAEPPAVPAYDDRFTADDAEAFREVAQVLQSTASMLHGNARQEAAQLEDEPVDPVQYEIEPEPPAALPVSEEEPVAAQPSVSDQGDLAQLADFAEDRILPLVSSKASQSIAATFSALDDVLRQQTGEDLKSTTEAMLRPMLAEWLDENLPSMVERLVRQEIERIGRGEPRAA